LKTWQGSAVQDWLKIGFSALISGTIASIASSAVLAIAAKTEGKAGPSPINATSHWLEGESAADVSDIDLAHTGVGYLTHHGACVFWASIMEWIVSNRRNVAPSEIALIATGVSALAAGIDYGITPKRFTAGWEEVLSVRSMGVAYAAMAVGLALGSILASQIIREGRESRDKIVSHSFFQRGRRMECGSETQLQNTVTSDPGARAPRGGRPPRARL